MEQAWLQTIHAANQIARVGIHEIGNLHFLMGGRDA